MQLRFIALLRRTTELEEEGLAADRRGLVETFDEKSETTGKESSDLIESEEGVDEGFQQGRSGNNRKTLKLKFSYQAIRRILRFVLSCGKDSTIKLWEVGTGRLVKQYLGAVHTQLRCQIHPLVEATNSEEPQHLTSSQQDRLLPSLVSIESQPQFPVPSPSTDSEEPQSMFPSCVRRVECSPLTLIPRTIRLLLLSLAAWFSSSPSSHPLFWLPRRGLTSDAGRTLKLL
ncbi:hypothetical protein KSP40_PGU017602 [Platanthera guangdongensis]|uniref:Uncharacterized protein n=1 Tax=Platanthera guangdongensis TaxID=2320717 RepID=A0ABR2N016_9ASPA